MLQQAAGRRARVDADRDIQLLAGRETAPFRLNDLHSGFGPPAGTD
jgi:hypothetical protein